MSITRVHRWRRRVCRDGASRSLVDAKFGTAPRRLARAIAAIPAVLVAILATAAFLGPAADAALGQLGRRKTPTDIYYAGFAPFYDGDYRAALRIFQSESRGSIKTAQSRWIDSICYETMCGECYFQMGQFDKALAPLHRGAANLQNLPRLDGEGPVSADPAGQRRRVQAACPGECRRGNRDWATIRAATASCKGRST